MRILPIALLATLALAAPAAAQVRSPLLPPAGHVPYDAGHARGVQTYTCTEGAWTFSGPRATLYDIFGQPKWTHFAGPTWQHRDGSSVVGAAVGNVTVDPNSIPWLLLKATSTKPGKFGDAMVKTTFIQRLATRGGLAPAGKCTEPGKVAEVPYTAEYVFWRAG